MKLPMLDQDKANHVIYGAVIWSVACFVAGSVLAFPHPQVIGIAATAAAALLKEVIDKRTGGTPDRWDLIATVAGGAAMWVGLING